MATTKISTPQFQLGTLIDGGSLELVEVLGVGGYGVVYRAIETYSDNPKSYAVKCLLHFHAQRTSRKHFHIREIALHQISSAHPGVVTLHRIIEDHEFTYIIMDYAPDHDLFTQILNHCRYIGDNDLIKNVFLQLLDAVEYCHSLGIYHRDLKPENVLCFDDGCRVAITDFGLATTEKLSGELRTGSIYHMSPECQGGELSPNGEYSPMANDVWSLGIILLNIATGRNPWKTATPEDPTFQAYLRSPLGFFPSVLPISPDLNEILLSMLHVDWRERPPLSELRELVEAIPTFYSDSVIFDGSMARCPWEVGLAIDGDTRGYELEHDVSKGLESRWSDDSISAPADNRTPVAVSSPSVVNKDLMGPNSMLAEGGPTRFERFLSRSPSSPLSPPTPENNLDIFGCPLPRKDGLIDIITGKSQEERVDVASGEVRKDHLLEIISGQTRQRRLEDASDIPMEITVEDDDYSDVALDTPSTSPGHSRSSSYYSNARGKGQDIATTCRYSDSRTSSTSTSGSSSSGDIFTRPKIPCHDKYTWSQPPLPPHVGQTSVLTSSNSNEGETPIFHPDDLFSHKPQRFADQFEIEPWPTNLRNESIFSRPSQAWVETARPSSPERLGFSKSGSTFPRKLSNSGVARRWFLPKFFASSGAAS